MKNLLSYLLFLSATIVIAQNYGSLNGRIINVQTQQPLVGATILLEGTSYGVVTDELGYFIINEIPSNSYNIFASYLGFETQILSNVIVKYTIVV